MCGVCGVFQPGRRMADLTSVLEDMTVALRHRGPDYSDVWVALSGEVAFGHSRLAIVDVSQAGSQPMSSANGRWTVTYNGEIYNSDVLRDRLPSVRWRGHSDTEVLVEYISRYGVPETLRAIKGMFAFGWTSLTLSPCQRR